MKMSLKATEEVGLPENTPKLWVYFLGVAVISILILCISVLSILAEKQRYLDQATISSRNISELLSQNISAEFDKADVLLQSVRNSLQATHTEIVDHNFSTLKDYISQSESVIPMALSLRVTDKNGKIILGKDVQQNNPVNLNDIDFFKKLREDSSDRLVVTGPVFGRISKQWMIVIARRINAHDGSFAGTVSVNFACSKFEKFLSKIALGRYGAATIRTTDLALISRFPSANDQIGSKEVSQKLREIMQINEDGGEYLAITAIDGIERSNTYHKLQRYPFYVIVGLGTEDFLLEWHTHIWLFTSLAVLAIFITCLAAIQVYRTNGRLALEVAEHKIAEKELRISAIAFESQEGISVTDANANILRVNQAFTNITGYSAEEVIGQNPRILKSGRQDKSFYSAMWEKINSTGVWEGEIWNKRKNGEIYPEHLIITAVKGSDEIVTNYVATLTDITHTKAAEDEIKYLAFYDPLTLLPNRRLLLDRLRQALASQARNGQSGALIFIDLDNFKTLNDTLGHDIGDMLLQQVANRLESCVREGDTVARLGGDEFVVMLEDLSIDSIEAAEQTKIIGRKILFSLNQQYQLGSHKYNNTPSIGATLFKNNEQSVDDLMKQADIAMYQSKKAGRNTLRFFDPQMQEAVDARANLEADLRNALEKNELEVFYQPIVNCKIGKIFKAEALLRWKHPDRGMISPALFIPLAEESGLILEIGEWVFMEAINTIEYWEKETGLIVQVSVNKSPVQFVRAERHPWLERLENSSLPKGCIAVEITEGLLVTNSDKVRDELLSFQRKGIEVSIDDFGTGFSSLSYLNQFHIDYLKIDISFIKTIVENESNRALTEAIIVMAHKLGIKTIAEGVETEAQRDLLIQFDCDYIQGFLYSKPVTAADFVKLIRT